MLKFDSISLLRSQKQLLSNFNIELPEGSTVALVGPNGSGKSSLALGLMGHPEIEVQGSIFFKNENILQLPAEKRARLGIFVSFQHPLELPGVQLRLFLREAQRSCGIILDLKQFDQQLNDYLTMVGLPSHYADRYYNVGFSGGEKKRVELLTMLMLNPQLVALDEIDSGLDAQGIEALVSCIRFWRLKNPQGILIIISHYESLLNQLSIDNKIALKAIL